MDEQNKILIYTDNNGLTRIDVKLEDDTLWLTQAQMCELYQTSKSNASEHIKHIFEDGELQQEAVVRKFRTTASDGKSYATNYYNLDMIIALGYRVRSTTATRFRQWATQRLKEYIQKGFTMDDDRLKKLGGGGYWNELLERIRDIRASEKPRNMNIATVFNKAGFIEAWGRGFKKISEGFASEGMPRPEYEETCGGVMVTIRRPDLAFSKANGGNHGGNATNWKTAKNLSFDSSLSGYHRQANGGNALYSDTNT